MISELSVKSFDEFINEARYFSPLNDRTEEMSRALNNTEQGRDLEAIGVYVYERNSDCLVLKRRGGPMATVEVWKDPSDGQYCYEYTSTKEKVERYNLSKFVSPENCYRALLLRIIRNNIPAAIIPKKDIPSLDFDNLVPIGSAMDMKEILDRMKRVIGGDELTDLDPKDVNNLPEIKNLEEMGMIGDISGDRPNRVKIIEKVDIISPKYKFYSRAAYRVGEIYGEMVCKIIGIPYQSLKNSAKGKGLLFDLGQEIWRVNNSNRLPLNSVNFRTGDNSVRCNIQEEEIFGSVFVAIFKRTFRRARGKYINEKLINSECQAIQSNGQSTVEIARELNDLLSDYFTTEAGKLTPTVFVWPDDSKEVYNNANAILLKYLYENGSEQLRDAITRNVELDELLDKVTKTQGFDELSKKILDLSRLLRYA
jgi:hypothetical protein